MKRQRRNAEAGQIKREKNSEKAIPKDTRMDREILELQIKVELEKAKAL